MILDTIVLHARRWKFIELAAPYPIYSKFEEAISNARFPLLRTFKLKIEVFQAATRRRMVITRPQEPPSLRILQTLDLSTFSISWQKYTTNFKTIPLRWNQLRRLFLHSAIQTKHFIPLLSECPNLVECRLWIEPDHDYHHKESDSGSDEDDNRKKAMLQQISARTVSLPHLQTFFIHDMTITVTTEAAYRAICAPTLRSVGYTRSYRGSVDRHGSVTQQLAAQVLSFCNFLETAPVERFMLALAYQTSETVLDVLKRVSQPKHVILGQKPLPIRQAESTGSPRYLDTMLPQSLPELNQFELDNLIITDTLPSTIHLLPNLEIFEAYGISNFSDDDAARMIKSRMSASKAGQISALKAVTLHFNRPMEKDIEEEVHQYADEIGAPPIKLELVYRKVERSRAHMIPQSSSYGLSQTEGLSWADAMEYDEFN